MNVTLCSAFRSSMPYLSRYVLQVGRLGNLLDGHLHVIWCEGDSTDRTYDALVDVSRLGVELGCYTADVFQHHHGGQDYGSVVNAERFANIARVTNAIWERIPADADAVIWVESDLIWEPATMLALLDDLAEYPAVSPMIMLKREDWPSPYFYDTWAARKDGVHIRPQPPYFDGWNAQHAFRVDSMGSCMAIRGPLARQLCWPAEDVFVGLSRTIYERGGSVWLDPKVSVFHP